MRKKFLLALMPLMLSCQSNNTVKEEKNQNVTGVENVNGNIPDTTNAINLGTQKKDTSQKQDSIK